jgi:hypothetical protein
MKSQDEKSTQDRGDPVTVFSHLTWSSGGVSTPVLDLPYPHLDCAFTAGNILHLYHWVL